ncbi:hypothetical protein [Leptolyngbya sp. 7M]|uniref:hypothetical protein n=1 Tax=Leptolyngbya sp. 7M TaxID=2812896 RepID=UPI001B8C99F6|nr:hypothetical protein [Leptolyngbya sp. 7M]QYO65332.1 hypothetical protein JVX88_00680 [Leptolyngbya sp. 7M]
MKNTRYLAFASAIIMVFAASTSTTAMPVSIADRANNDPISAVLDVSIDGKWIINVDAGGQTVSLAVEFKQNGTEFTGTMASEVGSGSFENGKINGDKVTAKLNADVQGSPTTIEFEGKVDGDKMTGTMNVPGFGLLSFAGTRSK